MDFMVEDRVAYIIEINPRFQNSTALFTVLETINGSDMNHMFLLHISEFLQSKDRLLKKYIRLFPKDTLMKPLKGSQVILHNTRNTSIITGELKPGIYRYTGTSLNFVQISASLTDCSSENDILITCGIPRQFTIVEANAPICKIQMLNNAINMKDLRTINSRTRKIISKVYSKLKLKSFMGSKRVKYVLR